MIAVIMDKRTPIKTIVNSKNFAIMRKVRHVVVHTLCCTTQSFMNSVLNQYLDCTDCMGNTLLSDAFDIAFQSWPQQMWIAYRCPTCDAVNHLGLQRDSVTQGYIDGGPAPCLIPTRQLPIPKLSVTGKPGGIAMKNLNLSWHISASP